MGFWFFTKVQLHNMHILIGVKFQRKILESKVEKSYHRTMVAATIIISVYMSISPSFSECIFKKMYCLIFTKPSLCR